MHIWPNRFDKIVVIPARVINGEYRYFNGGPLPKLREGAIFNLQIPEEAISDGNFVDMLQNSHYEDLLPKGQKIYAAVSSWHIPENLNDSALSWESLIHGRVNLVIVSLFTDSRFVEIRLKEPLCLQLRGTKHGRLKPAKCWIPSLNIGAVSLNHAYRLISEVYEPERISHAGNVFQKMLVIKSNTDYFPLEELRYRLEAGQNHGSSQTPSPEIDRTGANP